MKKINTFLIIIIIALSSCSGTQKTKSAISSGDYNSAFENAISKLNKDKSKYAKQIPLLKEAYDKANEKDLAEIEQLKKSNNKLNLKKIYNLYMKLDVRQDEIILLEPLKYEGKTYSFNAKDYTKEIKNSRQKYSDYLYNIATPLLYGSKENIRKAHNILSEIQVINPDYKSSLNQQIIDAKKRGMDYVLVKLKNNVSNQLQDSTSLSILKDFSAISTGSFKNKWITFHSKKDYNISYDYQADITLDKLIKIPEKLNKQNVNQTKEVQTGWKYKYDDNGNVMKDKDGNDIKIPKMEKVSAVVTLYQQVKSINLEGKITLKNLKINKILGTTPVKSEAKLENIYATYKGNPKAIEEKYYEAIKNKKKEFPNDSAFLKFTLQTFKEKVEQILANQKW